MSCYQSHLPEGSLSSLLPSSKNAVEVCGLARRAAAFLGFPEQQIKDLCQSAIKTVRIRHLKKTRASDLFLLMQGYGYERTIAYSKAARCPLLSAVIAAGAAFPMSGEIEENGVYTVGMAARLLDMTGSAVRRLVRSGELAGRRDAGGYLITGAALLAFIRGGVCVLGSGRRGVIRQGVKIPALARGVIM